MSSASNEQQPLAVDPGNRQLATIVTIATLEPIPADNILLATFKENSWQVVVKKNKVGDLAIYF